MGAEHYGSAVVHGDITLFNDDASGITLYLRYRQYLRYHIVSKVSGADVLTSEQLRAARMMLRWEQKDLADASKVSLPTIKRLETRPGRIQANESTLVALQRALEAAGVIFIAENGEGPGVRLKKDRA